MVTVCKQHVKQGLTMIFLPHVHPLTNEEKISGNFTCQLCAKSSDFTLFNYEFQRKHQKAI